MNQRKRLGSALKMNAGNAVYLPAVQTKTAAVQPKNNDLKLSTPTPKNRSRRQSSRQSEDGITSDTFELIPLSLVNKMKVITPLFDVLTRLTTKLQTAPTDQISQLLQTRLNFLSKYNKLLSKLRTQLSLTIVRKYLDFEDKIVSIYNQHISTRTQEDWCDLVSILNDVNMSIDNYIRAITKYCAVIHCVPPDLSVLQDRFHLIMRFNVEYLIITLSKYIIPNMNINDLSFIECLNIIYTLQNEYSCAVGRLDCSSCRSALRFPNILKTFAYFSNKLITNPPPPLCLFNLVYNAFYSKTSTATNVLSLIKRIAGNLPYCSLHYIYVSRSVVYAKHWRLDTPFLPDYGEYLDNYFNNFSLSKSSEKQRVTPSPILEWFITISGFVNSSKVTQRLDRQHIVKPLHCIQLSVQNLHQLSNSDKNTALYLAQQSLSYFVRYYILISDSLQRFPKIPLYCTLHSNLMTFVIQANKVKSEVEKAINQDILVGGYMNLFDDSMHLLEIRIGHLTEKIRELVTKQLYSNLKPKLTNPNAYVLEECPLGPSYIVNHLIIKVFAPIHSLLQELEASTRNSILSIVIDSCFLVYVQCIQEVGFLINRFGAILLYLDSNLITQWGQSHNFLAFDKLIGFCRMKALIEFMLRPPEEFMDSRLTDKEIWVLRRSYQYNIKLKHTLRHLPINVQGLVVGYLPNYANRKKKDDDDDLDDDDKSETETEG